jgi:phosphinothricin acetyltransferase
VEYRVRAATGADAEAVCRIYNQGIEDRLATLETELRTPDERRQWIEARGPRHPVIVAETEPATFSNRPPTRLPDHAPPATIIGWGSLNVFNARPAYQHVADFSVYVEREWRGKGVGRVLLERLVALGRELGYHKLVLSAFPFNTAGVALYERLGFRNREGSPDGPVMYVYEREL